MRGVSEDPIVSISTLFLVVALLVIDDPEAELARRRQRRLVLL